MACDGHHVSFISFLSHSLKIASDVSLPTATTLLWLWRQSVVSKVVCPIVPHDDNGCAFQMAILPRKRTKGKFSQSSTCCLVWATSVCKTSSFSEDETWFVAPVMLKFAGSVIGEAIQNVMDASEAAALARLDEYVILGSGFDLACSIVSNSQRPSKTVFWFESACCSDPDDGEAPHLQKILMSFAQFCLCLVVGMVFFALSEGEFGDQVNVLWSNDHSFIYHLIDVKLEWQHAVKEYPRTKKKGIAFYCIICPDMQR